MSEVRKTEPSKTELPKTESLIDSPHPNFLQIIQNYTHHHAEQHAEEKATYRATCTAQLAGHPKGKSCPAQMRGMRW